VAGIQIVMVADGLELELHRIQTSVDPAVGHELGVDRNRLFEAWRGPLTKAPTPFGLWGGKLNHLQ
jgi:hypothetical protein